MKSTGNRIQTRREELGWSRAELARRLDTTRMTVWRLENDRTKVKTDYLPKLARVLKTTATRLVA